MKEFAERIKNDRPEKGTAHLYFMGQAGFILKASDGFTLAYDIYLSDCCEREFGFKRLMPFLLEPDELVFDAVICSHGHYDHFDKDSVPAFMNNAGTHIYLTKCGMDELERLNVAYDTAEGRVHLIKAGDSAELGGCIKCDFVYCDHGPDTPYAVGTVINVEGKRIYALGDTSYREEIINDITKSPDYAILPINGAFGNMNETEAAFMAKKLGAGCSVPSHFWNFAEHGGNPYVFMQEADRLGVRYVLMRQGECLNI